MALDYFLADTLQRWGFMDFILPFILIFTIVFAILQKVKIFGKEDEARKFNIIVALVLGLAVVVPHALGMYPRDKDVVNIMLGAIPNVSVILVAILMALLIIGMLGKRVELGGGSLSGWIAMLAFVVVAFIFGNAAGWWDAPWFRQFLGNQELIALVVTILVFAVIIWFVTSEKSDPKEKGFGEKFGDLLKGGDDK